MAPAIARSVSIVLALGLLFSQTCQAQTAGDERGTGETDLLLLEVVVDEQSVFEGLTAYQANQDILLPLGELSRVLTLAISTQPGSGTASGYILQEERSFNLDLGKAIVRVDGKSESVDLRLVEVRQDDIYVASRLLAHWLPVDMDVDMLRLSLAVRPREQLPLQYRLEREAQSRKFGTTGEPGGPHFPLKNTPYRLLDWPFIDQTVNVGYQGGTADGGVTTAYSAYATADLLNMQGALYVHTGTDSESNEVWLTLGRNDPDAGLLGPLHARTALVGNILMPGVDNVSRTSAQGNGLVVSNRPLWQSSSFGKQDLQGPLLPGWDVELYFNDALIGFQASSTDGLYHFDDLTLIFGPNQFRLVFHGPLGQVRVETQVFLLEQSVTPPGEFYYTLAQQRDKEGRHRAVALFDWGLGEHLTASGGIIRAPVEKATQTYVQAGLQAYWSAMILSGKFVKSEVGSLTEVGLLTRLGKWSINMSHAQLDNFRSELYQANGNPVGSSTLFRIDGALSMKSLSFRLPVTVEATHVRRESGADEFDLAARMSVNMRGTSMTGQLHWDWFDGYEIADASLQISRRLGGVSLRGQVNYALEPIRELATVALTADWRLGSGYLQSVGVARSFGSSDTIYSAGLTKSLGRFGLGANVSYSSSGDIAAGLQLFMAMGREPRGGAWQFDAQPMANSGGVSALVFLDDNMNGRMDLGEKPVEGVAFSVNGGRTPVASGADGIAYLQRLPVLQHTDIALVSDTLEDPQWMPTTRGASLVPRPGAVAKLDFPVLTSSEIEGTAYLVENVKRREFSALEIQVVDAKGTVLATSLSASDGYYVLAGIPVGEYMVRVSPEQLQRMGLYDAATHPVTIAPDGWLVSGIDIQLQAR